LGKTGAQRVAKILGGKGQRFNDEFDFEIASTLKLKKYKAIENWYRNPKNRDYTKKLETVVAGCPHTFKWGGAHGALKKYYGEGIYVMADVTAYYPSLQLKYHWGYRNMGNPENFEKIHKENLRFKELGDKKARLPYKIADNAISGQLKDSSSPLYDPRDNNAICVNGQLFLVDLIEKLEPHIELFVQSNTDGVLFKIKSLNDFDKIDDIVWEWEQRTGMRMGFDIYTKVYQKDVNNYLLVSADGKTKTKGSYTKNLSPIDNDLPIINKAMVAYMKDKTPVETTINSCNELIMFQKVVKLSRKYWRAWHNSQHLTEKCYRVFASRNATDTYIGKIKKPGATIEKFGNTPEHCFFDNGNVIGKNVPEYLDKQWYISLAKDRLRQYGIEI
jgi:DNA polymerase